MIDASLGHRLGHLARCLDAAGVTQSRLAAELGVSQSQISRLLAGRTKRRTGLFERIEAYVAAMTEDGSANVETPVAELYAAIHDIWDGSTEHARALAHLIRATSALRSSSARGKAR